MTCFSPYFGQVAGSALPVPFPCGKCLACRESQASIWKLRCQFEAIECDTFAFVTLTYADEHLPYGNSLCPAHLSSFIKRLRKSLDYPIRYFACGEYGSRFGRPHYHLILFGLKREDYHLVKRHWPYADLKKYSRAIDVQEGHLESLGYVAGYVGKKLPVREYYKKIIEPPFHRCSLGLGLQGYLKRTLGAFQPVVLDLKNKKRYVGRYLRNKACEILGILEEVKELGIEDLSLKMVRILEAVPEHLALKKYFDHYGIRMPRLQEKMMSIWKFHFETTIDQFIKIHMDLSRKKQRLDL
ncbi:MAG: replication initiator protein [Microviridae sp.]|nr:MAG: replication initiator protein [Microviridae sp.]